MEKMDEALQQGKVMQGTCEKHAATDSKPGIHPDQIQLLNTNLEDASAKNTEQKKAVEIVVDLTTRQNSKMAEGGALVQKIREAAKGEYGEDDKARMKEFHVGSDVPKTVKGLVSELEYTEEASSAHKADLAKHGVKDADIQSLGTTADELSRIDTEQENAKKVQKAATKARDNSMKTLRKTIRKIQHSAKSIFADQPLVLIEFESISGGRGPGGKQTPPPPSSQPK